MARQGILVKIFPVALSIVAVSAASAFAADLPARVYTKAPAIAPGFSWTGFYVGGGGGRGFLTSETRPIDSATGLPLNSGITNGGRGIFGTVSAGYDYQFSDRIVGGVFGNYDFSNIRGFFSSGSAQNFFDPLGGRAQLDSSWAVGGRIGWLLDPKTLTYFNGGYTEARFTGQRLEGLDGNFPPTGAFLNGHTYSGWFLGSGVETKLDSLPGLDLLPGNGWFVRSEYRYADYGSATLPMLTAAGPFPLGGAFASVRTSPVVQTIRTELSYKFNIGGAPATTYVAAPIAPVNWTGFYIGGGGGYGLSDSHVTAFNTVTNLPLNVGADSGGRGFFGTVRGGFDYQFSDKIVVGVLANYDFADIKGDMDTTLYENPFSAIGGRSRLKDSWAVGARIGRLVTPQTLTYVTGGYNQARFDGMSLTNLATGLVAGAGPAFVGARSYDGWFVGSGVESKLNFLPGNGWFVRTEYRYADYGSQTTPVTTTGGGPFVLNGTPVSLNIHPIVQTVRTELSYKFNWDGPVVAKY